MKRWMQLYLRTRAEWQRDTRGWEAIELNGMAAHWEREGDAVRGGTGVLARRCDRLAEMYRMKAEITGAIGRGER